MVFGRNVSCCGRGKSELGVAETVRGGAGRRGCGSNTGVVFDGSGWTLGFDTGSLLSSLLNK
jgi:hypothetical protein